MRWFESSVPSRLVLSLRAISVLLENARPFRPLGGRVAVSATGKPRSSAANRLVCAPSLLSRLAGDIFFREHPKAVRRCKLQRHGFRRDGVPIEQNDPSLKFVSRA
jgi:hypothetical protein